MTYLVSARLLCLASLLLPSAALADTIVPTASDRADFASGVALARSVDIWLDPNVCAIVLERERCLADVAVVHDREGRPTPAKIVEQLTSGDATALKSANPFDRDEFVGEIPDTLWTSAPTRAWLLHAGQVSVWSRLRTAAFFSSDMLWDHAATSGIYGPLSGDVRDTALLDPKLDALFPFDPIPAIVAAPDEVQLGVYAATANELFDSPFLLGEPQSRLFISALTSRLVPANADAATVAAAKQVDDGLALDQPLDKGDIGTLSRRFTSVVLAHVKAETSSGFLFGEAAAQCAYNAMVYRDRTEDANFRLQLHNFAQPSMRGLDDATAALAAIPRDADWNAIGAAATRLTRDIMKPPPG